MQTARNRNLVLKKDLRKLKKKNIIKKRDPDPDPDPESAFYGHPHRYIRTNSLIAFNMVVMTTGI